MVPSPSSLQGGDHCHFERVVLIVRAEVAAAAAAVSIRDGYGAQDGGGDTSNQWSQWACKFILCDNNSIAVVAAIMVRR